MNHRIVRYNIVDLILDPVAVAAALTKACRRDHEIYHVTGLCQTADEVVFALEATNATREPMRYVIAPFPGLSMEDVIADIWSRWGSGFTTRGLIRLEGEHLGLFEILASVPVRQPHLALADHDHHVDAATD